LEEIIRQGENAKKHLDEILVKLEETPCSDLES
jgi:hypothetical protein